MAERDRARLNHRREERRKRREQRRSEQQRWRDPGQFRRLNVTEETPQHPLILGRRIQRAFSLMMGWDGEAQSPVRVDRFGGVDTNATTRMIVQDNFINGTNLPTLFSIGFFQADYVQVKAAGAWVRAEVEDDNANRVAEIPIHPVTTHDGTNQIWDSFGETYAKGSQVFVDVFKGLASADVVVYGAKFE